MILFYRTLGEILMGISVFFQVVYICCLSVQPFDSGHSSMSKFQNMRARMSLSSASARLW